MKKLLLFALILFSASVFQDSFAQNTPEKKITMRLDSARFHDFVRQVESQTGYFFYYDAVRFDSLALDLNVENQTIREVLDQVFKGSEFEYAIDGQKRIYITQGPKIITQLQPGLFDPNATESNALTYTGPEDGVKEKLLSSAESKVHEIGIKKTKITPGNSTLTGYVRNAITGPLLIFIKGI